MTSQEKAAHGYLAQGRFREAREEFKSLCKQDRPRFLPFLIEANLGLARSMIRLGQVQDAGQVLAYLKTITAPGSTAVQKLEAEIAMELEVRQAPNAFVHLLDSLAKSPSDDPDRVQKADRLVLLFPESLDPDAEKMVFATELLSVVSALKMVSEKAFVGALDVTRIIGHQSPFSHWRLFIKALVAFHQGDRDKAERFFSGLPSNSVPGRAAGPFRLLLGSRPAKGQATPTVATLEAAGKMLGESGMGRALWKAEQSHLRGEAAQVYLDLRSGLARFPDFGTSLRAALTDYAVHSYHLLDPDQSHDFGQKVIASLSQQDIARKSLESMVLLRMTVQADYPDISDSDINYYFEAFLEAWEAQNGRNPSFASVAYAWLGRVMMSPRGATVEDEPNWEVGDFPRNPALARLFFENAIGLDPTHLQAHLDLCEVFLELNLLLEGQQLLERMVTQFPGEKNVLLRASEVCLVRNSLGKAIGYLEMAYQYDRIDPTIPDRLAGAYLRQATEQYLKKRADFGRKSLAKAEGLSVDDPFNFVRSSWCLATRKGVLESVLGSGLGGKTDLVRAQQLSPSEAAFLFFAYWIAHQLGKPAKKQKEDFERQFKRLSRISGDAKDALLLTRIWPQIEMDDCLTEPKNVFSLLLDYLKSISRKPMGREEAKALVEFASTTPSLAEIGRTIATEQLKKDSRDPFFRYAELCDREQRDETFPGISLADLEELQEEAQRRKDSTLVQRLQKAMDAVRIHGPNPRRHFSDELDDELFSMGSELDDPIELDRLFGIGVLDDDRLKSVAEKALRALPSEERIQYEKMITFVRGLSDHEFEQFKKTRPPDFPRELFDMLVLVARGKIPK